MFSKALFKQSCKANGAMWGIITFAVCFMLACVMLISGSGNIGEVKNSIQDTIITKEVDAQLDKRALSYYADADEGLEKFDDLFTDKATDTLSCLLWCSQMPTQAEYPDLTVYAQAVSAWQAAKPEMATDTGEVYAQRVTDWLESMPAQSRYTDLADIESWKADSPATQEAAVAAAYADACQELQDYIQAKAADLGYAPDSTEEQEMLGSVMYALNPDGMFDDFYTDNGEDIPEDYDFMSLLTHISQEKYEYFGYTYSSVKHMANTAVVTYQGRLDYELGLLAAPSSPRWCGWMP